MNIFDILLGVLVGIVVMTIVVTVHEFGHFLTAKKNGVNVKEFGIGFPPKAKTWLHVPRKEVEKYCKKFKYDDVKTERILQKIRKTRRKNGSGFHYQKMSGMKKRTKDSFQKTKTISFLVLTGSQLAASAKWMAKPISIQEREHLALLHSGAKLRSSLLA
jgi:hypothetical protein